VISTLTLADLLVSASEVAVIVTTSPAGTTVGATYVVDNIRSAVNDPHELEEPDDPQVALQITPAPVGSFVTCAETACVVLTISDPGNASVIATTIGVATTVKLKLLLCAGLLVTVAVIVIAPSIGATDGAVYTVAPPSAV
jgi:hypothetical protein